MVSVTGSSSPPPPTSSLMNPTANSVIPPPPSMAPAASDPVSHTAKSSSCHNQLCKQGPGAVAGVVTVGAFFALFAGVIIWVFFKRFKREKKSESLAPDVIKMPKEFTYRELKSATKCFNSTRIIGHGAFGTVYKGIIPDTGDIVAVKRCSHSTQGKNEFLSELSIIGTLRHRNLVRLQGWCHEKGEILLVYDLMLNGSMIKLRNRRWECRFWECRLLKFFKFRNRRCECRPSLPPVSKRTNLVIFFKLDLEFGFFFLNELLSYKTQRLK